MIGIGCGLVMAAVNRRQAGASGSDPSVSINWTTLSNNRTPSFQVNASNWQPGDILDFQLDSDAAFGSVIATNIGAIIGLPATITSDILADGTYYARARIERGGTAFAWSAPTTITIHYLGPAPTVADTSASVSLNTAKAIDVSSLITGASHTAIGIATGPAHGSVGISGDVITYTPTTGYSGPDSFTYTATGPGGTSQPGTVSVTIANFVLVDSSTTYFTSSTVRIY